MFFCSVEMSLKSTFQEVDDKQSSLPYVCPSSKSADDLGAVNDTCSVCDSLEGSVSSDLTRMCVSDEEDKVVVETPEVGLHLRSDSSLIKKDMDVT